MKYVKKFEARNQKANSDPNSVKIEKQMEKIMDEWEMSDNTSHVTFQEFFDNFPFDACSKYDYNKFSSAGIFLPKGTKVRGLRDLYGSSDFGPTTPSYFADSKDWAMRYAVISADVRTGGYSGGSCWDTGDDDGATPYETGDTLELDDFLEYLSSILNAVIYRYDNTKSVNQLIDILRSDYYSMVGEDYYTQYEYYGNSDNFTVRYITLYNLFKFLSKTDSF